MSHQASITRRPYSTLSQIYILMRMSNYDGKGKQENGQRGVCPSLFLPAIFELLCYNVDHCTKRLRKCVFNSRIKYSKTYMV